MSSVFRVLCALLLLDALAPGASLRTRLPSRLAHRLNMCVADDGKGGAAPHKKEHLVNLSATTATAEATAVAAAAVAAFDDRPLAPVGEEFKVLGGHAFVDTSATDSLMAEIKALLALRTPSHASDERASEAVVAEQMAALLSQLGSGDDVRTELTVLKRGLQEGETISLERKALAALSSAPPAARFCCGPVTLVHGSGPVGQRVLEELTSLHPAVSLRSVDAGGLLALQDAELALALRDVLTVIVAADSASSRPTGWFSEEPAPAMDAERTKRLLDAVVAEHQRRGAREGVKVVFLGRATHVRKGLAAVLLSGDAVYLESDAVLQCQARGVDYAMVKVGSVIADEDLVPKGVRNRNAMSRDREIERAIAITTGVVEASEVTRVSVAAEALLRAAAHPQRNSSMAVLSSHCADTQTSDEEWDDEFLKIQGPELLRQPLVYASERQTVLRLHSLASRFAKPGSGLVTPVECTRFVNGIRFEFRPVHDSFKYSEEEERAEKGSKKLVGSDESEDKKRAPKPEGGLEVIVDAEPYLRVRVRRCCMAPDAVVKVESEALILKEIAKLISVLENDYKIILTAKAG